jgi:hypothetical protein
MLWFYEHDQGSLTLETCYDAVAAQFVVRVRWPDGREQTERLADLEAFRRWLAAFDRLLETDRWRPGNAIILPYGWPTSRLT